MSPVRKCDAAFLELGVCVGRVDLDLVRLPGLEMDDLGVASGHAGGVEESACRGLAEFARVRREPAELLAVDAPCLMNTERSHEPEIVVHPELRGSDGEGPVGQLGKKGSHKLDAADVIRRAHEAALFDESGHVLVSFLAGAESIHVGLALVRRDDGARPVVIADEDGARGDVAGAYVASIGGEDLLVVPETQVHGHTLVDLLPKVGAEDLDQRNLERRELPVHEDAGEVELDLKSDVDVRAVDRRGPPEREAAVGDLVQPRPLGVRQLLVLHALFEAAVVHHEKIVAQEPLVAIDEEAVVSLRSVLLRDRNDAVGVPVSSGASFARLRTRKERRYALDVA
mmetsp:Transcript_24497/g.79135  ORF Transcript_24497/g.79135 Transcript_24497/m.79135 type:complete len:341 (-) Transcript_24497:2935-3957(-)